MNSKWDQRYLDMAEHISSWSRDPSKKIGAVAVEPNTHRVLSVGYNGFPRNIKDSNSRYSNRKTKYKYVVHAEMNAIYNASYNGVSLNQATLYVYGLPICSECAKGIIQVGIKRVIMRKMEIPDNWKESWNLSQNLFDEAGITYRFI